VDDLRGLSPWLRLAIEVGAAVVMFDQGVRVNMFAADGLDLAFTIVWVVGIVNALNLLDNMDGLSAGVACIAGVSFFAIAVANGQDLVAALSLAIAGCAAGFLRHNFHPARIYMGDAGSLFLGFTLAVIGLKLRFDGPNQVTFFVPILVLGVAIFDTTLVTVTRLIHHRSPVRGGRDHTSHRLVFVGLPVRVAVGLIYLSGAVLGWLALVTARVDRASGFLLMGLVLVLALLGGTSLGAVPVYETSRRRRLMISEVLPHEPPPDEGLRRLA
jgi:UDP-GlcNAc:undecaprenyl-phosphate GlcNAc-1-phosphate transferase